MMIKAPACFKNLSIVSLLLFPLTGQSIELNAELSKSELSVVVSKINYPERIFNKDLKSGLPNDISLLISVSQNGIKQYLARLNYQITYDLWDEVYQIQITSRQNANAKQVQKAQHELAEFIRQIRFTSQDAVLLLMPDTTYHLTAQVLVNPVKKERINKIRKWIAESQGYEPVSDNEDSAVYAERSATSPHRSPPGNVKSSSIGNQSGSERVSANRPRFQKLFDQILEQYMDENEVPALWHSKILNQEIRLKSSTGEE